MKTQFRNVGIDFLVAVTFWVMIKSNTTRELFLCVKTFTVISKIKVWLNMDESEVD